MDINSTQSNETMLPFYQHQAYVFTFLLSVMFVFGLFANGLTFLVIAKSKLRISVFNIFLMSLCVSDFLSALFSPLFIYRRTWGYESWNLPGVFCKLFFGMDQWTSLVTAAHITAFSVLRLISVRWPHTFGKITVFHAKVSVTVLWIITLFSGFIPFFLFCGIIEKDRNAPKFGSAWPTCSLLIDWIPTFKMYAYFGYTIFFYIPIISVIIISITIAILLWKRRNSRLKRVSSVVQRTGRKSTRIVNEKQIRKDRQALMQLSLIVGSFLIGYVPHIVYHFYTSNTVHSTQFMRNLDWIFGMTEYTCLRFSECLNPVLYNLSSSKIRKQTLLFISGCGKCECRENQIPRNNRASTHNLRRAGGHNAIPMQSTSRSSLST